MSAPAAAPLPAAASAWRPYRAFLRAAFHKTMAYRLRYYTGIVSYLVYVTTYYFLWQAIYTHRATGAELEGFDLGAMTTYVVVGWVARSFYFNNVDREIADLIHEGDVVLTLARPVSFQGMFVAGALGESLFRLVFFSLPVGAVLWLLFPVRGPAGPAAAAAFGVSCLLALLVLVHLNFLVGLVALKLKSIQGVMRAKHYLLELLSGLLMPVTLFPDWLETASRWLPFQAISYLPTSIYLGRLQGAELGQALLVQGFWAVSLAGLSAWVWRRAARHLTVHGG